MTGVRRSVDAGRLSAAASRPGVDTRIWLTLAIVKDIGFDREEGVFVDVQYQPTGENETCYLAMPYAGLDFGAYFPVEVDDTVLVAVPSGDPNNGPWVIARAWNAGDRPPADFGSGTDAIDYVYIKTKEGKNFKIVTQGENSQILFQDGSQSFVRGDDNADAVDSFIDNGLTPWIELVRAGIIAGGGSLDNTAFTQAMLTFKQDVRSALSSRIKGQ